MRARDEWRCALSMMAAVAGTALAPGRAVALFFGQLKSTAWLGVAVASALFGMITGMLAWRGQAFGGSDALSGAGRLTAMLRSLFAALLLAVMLAAAGDLGALTLPVSHGYALGAALTLLAALGIGLAPGNHGAAMGLCAVAFAAVFYAALAADPRPVRLYLNGETELRLAGSVSGALLLGLLYAALNGCAAGMAAPGMSAARPAGVGLKCGALLAAVLALGCRALARGGDALLAHPEPWVALAARMGLPGFWCCAALGGLSALTTTATAVRSLLRHADSSQHRRDLAVCLLVAAVLFGALSAGRL